MKFQAVDKRDKLAETKLRREEGNLDQTAAGSPIFH